MMRNRGNKRREGDGGAEAGGDISQFKKPEKHEDKGAGGRASREDREGGADLPQLYHPITLLNRGEFALRDRVDPQFW